MLTSSSLARTSILRHVNKIDHLLIQCWKPRRHQTYSNSQQRKHASAASLFNGNFEVKNAVGADLESTSTSTPTSTSSDKMLKRKFTLLLGYVGSNYFGAQLQLNPMIPTIERAVLDAMLKANLVLPSNAADLSRLSWSRSSRTDKGVHCSLLMIACKMECMPAWLDTPTKSASEYRRSAHIVDLLNEHLPKDIKVFSCCRVNGGFNSRKIAIWREYEYLLPLKILQQQGEESVSVLSEQELIYRLNSKFHHFKGTHSFHNFHRTSSRDLSVAPLYAKKQRKAADTSVNNDNNNDSVNSGSNNSNSNVSNIGSSIGSIDNSKSSVSDNCEEMDIDLQKDEEDNNEDSPIDEEEGIVGDSKLQHLFTKNDGFIATLQSVYTSFESRSDAAMNITKEDIDYWLPFDVRKINTKTYRSIQHFKVRDVVEIDGDRFARVVIRGSSFMLHQIRLMIGAAIIETARKVPENFIKYSLQSPLRVIIPMAPPEGLILTKLGLKADGVKVTEPLFTVDYNIGDESCEGRALKRYYSENVLKVPPGRANEKKKTEKVEEKVVIMSRKEFSNCEMFKEKFIYPKIKEEWARKSLVRVPYYKVAGSRHNTDPPNIANSSTDFIATKIEDEAVLMSAEESFHASLQRYQVPCAISAGLMPRLFAECEAMQNSRAFSKIDIQNRIIDESIIQSLSIGIENVHLYIAYNNDQEKSKRRNDSNNSSSGLASNSNSNSYNKNKNSNISVSSNSSSLIISSSNNASNSNSNSSNMILAKNLLPYGFYNYVVERTNESEAESQCSPQFIKDLMVLLAWQVARGDLPRYMSCEQLWRKVMARKDQSSSKLL